MEAQQKLSLDDVTPGGIGYEKFVPETFSQMQWKGNALVFCRDSAIIGMYPETQKEIVFCSLSQLNSALEKAHLKAQKKIPNFFFNDNKSIFCFELPHLIVFFDYKKQEITQQLKLQKGFKNKDFCPLNGLFAFTQGNNLWIVSPYETVKVNQKSEKDVVYGQAVHRNEFGITKGTFWSPRGNFLAFYRMDESAVSNFELVDNSKSSPKTIKCKYPSVGESSHYVTIGIYSIKTGETTYLPTAKPYDRFFTCLSWSPNERLLLIAELNRAQDTCELKAYDVDSGISKVLFTESSSTYIEPENPPFFIDNEHFIWQSKRSAHNHFYLHNIFDSSSKSLTKGDWDVLSFDGFNSNTATLIYSSTENSPLEKSIYALNIYTAEKVALTCIGGQHECLVAKSGKFLVDNYSSFRIPRKIDIILIDTQHTVNILKASFPYEGFDVPQFKIGTLKAADKRTDLYYRLTLPSDFDPTKKYPVIVHVYGGPHVQMVQNKFLGGSKGWELYMAEQGFICFTLDNRGSLNRGQAFEEVVFRNIGKAAMDDQLQGVAFLKSLPYVDSSRLGVYGWSFGGFMSTQLMTKAPTVFKVGVAGGAVIDWRLYEIMYGERYMQTPLKNPDGYAENDLTDLAKNLQGKFMMIHCELDPVVKITNTERFLKSAKKADKKVEFVRYQKHEHNVLGKERVGLFEKITAFFVENL